MKDLFPEHYFLNEEEFKSLWSEAIFSFDANVLLNLYRFGVSGREQLFNVFDKLKDQIQLTHQAAYEYQKNRIKVIIERDSIIQQLKTEVDILVEKVKNTINPTLSKNELSVLLEKQRNELKGIISGESDQYLNLLYSDEVRTRLDDLTTAKIGKPYTPQELDDKQKVAQKRFSNKIPPGYKDEKNKDNDLNKYGDFILWSQLLDLAKEKKKPIIFVSDEQKEDWILEVKPRKIGSRPELIKEMFEFAGVRFHLYSTQQFLRYAKGYLGVETGDATEQAKNVWRRNEALYAGSSPIIDQPRRVLVTSGSLITTGLRGGGWALSGDNFSLSGGGSYSGTNGPKRAGEVLTFDFNNSGGDLYGGPGNMDGNSYDQIFYEGYLRFRGELVLPNNLVSKYYNPEETNYIFLTAPFQLEGYLSGCPHSTISGCAAGFLFKINLYGQGLATVKLWTRRMEEGDSIYDVSQVDYGFDQNA